MPGWIPKLVTTFGIVCFIVGVSWGFIHVGTHFRFFDHSAGLFLTMVPVGILLSIGGTLVWARHWDRRERLRVAGTIFVIAVIAIAVVAFMIVPSNVHGPGVLLVLAAICACILSLVLAVMAVVTRSHPAI